MWFWLSTDWYKKTKILAVPYQPDHGNWCIKDHYILMKVGSCKILLCMRQMIDKLVRILEKYTVNHLTCWQNLYRICSISSCFYHTVSLLNQTPQMAREPKYLERSMRKTGSKRSKTFQLPLLSVKLKPKSRQISRIVFVHSQNSKLANSLLPNER